jgi:hypothetical protein
VQVWEEQEEQEVQVCQEQEVQVREEQEICIQRQIRKMPFCQKQEVGEV